MFLLMRQYVAAVVGVVVTAHHNVVEKTERTRCTIGENNGVASVVGDMLALAQLSCQTHGLNHCHREYSHDTYYIYTGHNVSPTPY